MSVKKRLEEPKTLYNCWTIEDADRLAVLSLIEAVEDEVTAISETDWTGYGVTKEEQTRLRECKEATAAALKVVID